MSGLERTLVSGGLNQIDYDDKGRITVLHVRSAYGERSLIRISYPEPDDLFAAPRPEPGRDPEP